MAGERVTMRDVAKRAGVDKAVVSKLLSGDAHLRVRDETRAKVMHAVDELGYVPNHSARSLRTKRVGMIGVTIPTFTNPVYAAIIESAEAEAARREVFVLAISNLDDADSDPFTLLRQGRIDGLLLCDQSPVPADMGSSAGRWLALNNRGSGSDRWVILDDEHAAELAVQHLVGLGHCSIAFVSGPSGSDTARRRLGGYRAAVRRAGLTVDESLIASGDYTADGGAAAIETILGRDEAKPTAIFVANLISAAGVLRAVKQHEMRVPDDISIVAVHDLPLADLLDPPLTTVSLPLAELGRVGVDRLLDHQDRPVAETIRGQIKLVERQSTAPPTN